MKIGKYKDGGPESYVTGWFIESKRLGSLALLSFAPGSREAFHSHAFNSHSIVVGPGHLEEVFYDGSSIEHKPGSFVHTKKKDLHKVYSHGTTYVLTVRGPWGYYWNEIADGYVYYLEHGRGVIAAVPESYQLVRYKLGLRTAA